MGGKLELYFPWPHTGPVSDWESACTGLMDLLEFDRSCPQLNGH